MKFTARPLTARLLGQLRRSKSPLGDAVEEHLLCPAATQERPPAIYQQDELSRIRGVHWESSMEAELERIRAGMCEHRATRTSCYRNVRLLDGTLYGSRGYQVIQFRARKRWLTASRPRELATAQLCSSYVAERYFGHWLTDALALELLAGQRKLLPLAPAPVAPRGHESGYRSYCGLTGIQSRDAYVARLWVVDDVGFTSHRVARLQILRARLGAELNAHVGAERQQRSQQHIVFVHRGRGGAARHLRNESELVSALQARNILCIDPTRMDVSELRPILNRAYLVLGVEGSALMHALMMMPRAGALLTIQPPERFNTVLKGYADALGIHYGFTVAEAAGEGFHLPLDRLLRALELTLDTAARHNLDTATGPLAESQLASGA